MSIFTTLCDCEVHNEYGVTRTIGATVKVVSFFCEDCDEFVSDSISFLHTRPAVTAWAGRTTVTEWVTAG